MKLTKIINEKVRAIQQTCKSYVFPSTLILQTINTNKESLKRRKDIYI